MCWTSINHSPFTRLNLEISLIHHSGLQWKQQQKKVTVWHGSEKLQVNGTPWAYQSVYCETANQLINWAQLFKVLSTDSALNVNSGSLSILSNAFYWITFYILFRASNHLPWSQKFLLKFFFGKEKASRKAGTTSYEAVRSDLVPYRDFVTHCRRFAACSLFPKQNFQEKPLGPRYQSSNCRQKEWNRICFGSFHIWIQILH